VFPLSFSLALAFFFIMAVGKNKKLGKKGKIAGKKKAKK
jgi:hypothetical protein